MAFPGTYNINYYKGDTLQFDIYPKNSSGAPFSLSGYSAAFTVATARGSSATQYSGTATIVDDKISCVITPSVGGNLSASVQYVYDVQISNLDNSPQLIYTVLTGTVSVRDHVTGAIV
jgi:hypothetical protein